MILMSIPTSYGHDPYSCKKIRVIGQLFLKIDRKQTEGRTDTTDRITFSAKAVGEITAAIVNPRCTPCTVSVDCYSGSKEIKPTVNGMRVFGISKGQIQRAVVRFKEPPEKHPLTVCFHFPSNFLTHRYVLDISDSQWRRLSNDDDNDDDDDDDDDDDRPGKYKSRSYASTGYYEKLKEQKQKHQEQKQNKQN